MCVSSVHPAAAKVEKVNGRLIRKLGSRHASLPSHYSSLIGGPLPKGEHNMIGSGGCVWEGQTSKQKYSLHNKVRDRTIFTVLSKDWDNLDRVRWTLHFQKWNNFFLISLIKHRSK